MSGRSERSFSHSDQIAFAKLSGDYNPMHLDEVAARRTSFGRPVVHGMHIALWMLEWLSANGDLQLPFRKISARFNRPVFLDEVVTLEMRRSGASIELACLCEGALLAQMKLSDPAAIGIARWEPRQAAWSNTPAELDIERMAEASGYIDLPYSEETIARFFPGASSKYGAASIAHMLALTRIVGMEIPGLHSLFGAFAIEMRGGGDGRMRFSTSRVNTKTSHVQLRVESDVLAGSVDAFVRARTAQPDHGLVSGVVVPGEFAHRRSLIVGGSRGLGLVSAYLLGAGGADVVITYRVGRAEAEEGVRAICNAGGRAKAVPLDVAAPAAGFDHLSKLGFQPTDVYYFATPHIFERKTALFEKAIFDRFVKCYVTDFAGVLDACEALSSEQLSVFYPSSDALNLPIRELMEYSAAKAAGEAFCEMTSRFNPRIKVLTARLPRLPTDQTATLMKLRTADPAQVMLDICRKMR